MRALGTLKAFVLGAVAVGIVAYALAAALAVTAQTGRHTLHLAVGPLVVVSVTHETAAAVTTFGPGIAVIALAGGLVNLAAAQYLKHHGRPGTDRVE